MGDNVQLRGLNKLFGPDVAFLVKSAPKMLLSDMQFKIKRIFIIPFILFLRLFILQILYMINIQQRIDKIKFTSVERVITFF